MLRQRQALKILRGARELLAKRARELREQARQALELVEKADAAEVGDRSTLWVVLHCTAILLERQGAGAGGEGGCCGGGRPQCALGGLCIALHD